MYLHYVIIIIIKLNMCNGASLVAAGYEISKDILIVDNETLIICKGENYSLR